MNGKILVIQTAFTGDVILSTSVAEKLHSFDPLFEIDYLIRKGNESLFKNHPFVHEVIIWDKNENKYGNLRKVISTVREKKYDHVINLQRFASTGIITAFSGAKMKSGFRKNPFSFLFDKKIRHVIREGVHETDRNQMLIEHIAAGKASKPKLYPSEIDYKKVEQLKQKKFITIAPSSVWYTKTFPAYKWMELINAYRKKYPDHIIYLLGSKSESGQSEYIIQISGNNNLVNLCGQLNLLESAALVKDAVMNYTNDSAPGHLASAMNAPVTMVYCSTFPGFGFGPLSEQSFIAETSLDLDCRPCGLHGYKDCPLIHFKCAHSIDVSKLFS